MFKVYPYRYISTNSNLGRSLNINNLFEDFFNDDFYSLGNSPRNLFRIDLRENDDAYLIEADLPGIKKEEVKVDYKDNNLTISVDREEQNEEINYIHKERIVSSMKRSLYFKDIIHDQIKAKLEDGVLKVIVPKDKKEEESTIVEIE